MEFTDSDGARHALRDWFHGRPVVLYFGYARCPQLCTVVADTTVAALRQIRAQPGRDFEVISISLDPRETGDEARQRRREAVRRYGEPRSSEGWHFLVGEERSIRAVADACGFHYRYDEASRQYAHPSGFVVVTPDGIVSRYFIGLEFPARDVAAAIAHAARGETGPRALEVLLRCFRGDHIGGRYGALIWRVLQIAVALTVLVVAGGIGRMLPAERRARLVRLRATRISRAP
jgi:protein SCO1/2